jgi:hypothetical protein
LCPALALFQDLLGNWCRGSSSSAWWGLALERRHGSARQSFSSLLFSSLWSLTSALFAHSERLFLTHAVERLGSDNMAGLAKAVRRGLGAADDTTRFSAKECAKEHARMLEAWALKEKEPCTAKKLSAEASKARLVQLHAQVAKSVSSHFWSYENLRDLQDGKAHHVCHSSPWRGARH